MICIIALVSCLGNLSQTAVNAMYTSIAADFGTPLGQMQWATTLYMLVLGIVVPIVTYLMRRFSIKQLVLASILFLLAGSIFAPLAASFPLFVAGRVLQAVATGITMPLMASVIMMRFPPSQQATVMGITGIAMGFAPNIGPTVGGAMVGLWGWQSFFVMLAGFGVLLYGASVFLIEQGGKEQEDARLDLFSFVLSALGFGGLLVGCTNVSSYSFASPFVWLPLLVGVVGLVWFVARQKRIRDPLIHMDIFKTASFKHGFWALNFLFTSFLGVALILPLFVENVWGGTPLQAGLSLIAATCAALVCNPLGGFLADKIGTRPVALVASVFLAIGAVSMIFINVATPFWLIVLLQGVRAIGVSSLIGPLMTWSLAGLSRELVADGSAFSAAVRQALASVGTAIMVFFITLLGGTMGFHLAFGFSAVFALLVLWIAVAKVR